ncbi:MAG TPA: CAP domain-containing protein [Thermoanaerobaculia bacterium]
MRRLLFGVLLVAMAATASAADITRDTVLSEMNRYREQHGLSVLVEDLRLTKVAEYRVRDMEEMSYWAHVSPDGRSPFAMLRPYGYDYQAAGENLASGFETAEILVESWMESKGHRDNILSGRYDHCGIAIIEGATTGRATGQSVVVIFARQLIPLAPKVAKAKPAVKPIEPARVNSAGMIAP